MPFVACREPEANGLLRASGAALALRTARLNAAAHAQRLQRATGRAIADPSPGPRPSRARHPQPIAASPVILLGSTPKQLS